MKSALTNSWKWLLGGLLTLLGFSNVFVSCKKEYGCPYADYKLVGDVKDTNGKPIEGIRVVFDRNPAYQGEYKGEDTDTLYTDAQGHFEKLRTSDSFWSTSTIAKFEDVDGAEHGSFKTKVLTNDELVMEQTSKGDRHWYGGVFTVHADATLEEED